MKRHYLAALLLALPLALAPACSDRSDDRTALAEDELDRELDLAIQGDTAPVTFTDTARGVAPQPEAEAPPQVVPQPQPRAPQRTPQRTPRAVPTPQPQERSPEPEVIRREPRVVTSVANTGTTFSVRLNETLSTETNRVGDGFSATLSAPILGSAGEVVIPAGALIRGRLTQVAKSGHVGETGIISLAFESVSFDGRSLPIEGSVVKANPQRKNRTPAKEQAAKAAGGAAAGAILGRVLGKDTKSTITGAVIGAAAGTAIAMGTADVDVVLPAGSEMVIKLDAPIEVRR